MPETPGRQDYLVKVENVTAGYLNVTSFSSLTKTFTPVLRNINLSMRDGERVAVIGESGSGKTTLLKVILGLLRPVMGRVLIEGLDIYSSRKAWLRAVKRIGYVPQDPFKALDPRVKIKTSLMEPLETTSYSKEEANKLIKEAVKLVGLPEEVLDYYPASLSGGMLQRVLIARALINRPKLFLLDEPTSSLDVSTQAQIINLINTIYHNYKMGVLLVTHDLAVAQYLAERVIILREGRIVEEGFFEDVILNPRHEYTRLLVKSYMMEPV